MNCPSELALEAHLLDPERAGVAAHLGACEGCAARLATMKDEGEDFQRFVFPRTLDAILEKAAPAPRRSLWRSLLVVPALVAAGLAVVVVATRSGPESGYIGVKGEPLSLAVFAAAPGGARRIDSGAKIPAAAAVRFEVHAGRSCHLWVLSVDAEGEVSRIYPAEGGAPAPFEKSGALPGGAVLDGRPGRERFVAVCSPQPLPFRQVEVAVRALARRDPAARLDGMPRGTLQASVVVEKAP